MISFVVFVITCWLLRAQSLEEYCYALQGDCEYDFLCMLDGDGVCGPDENAEVSLTPMAPKTGGADTTYSYYSGSGTDTIYVSYSAVKIYNDIDVCSLEYTISLDLYDSAYCNPSTCGMVNYGTDSVGASIDACFDICWSNPALPSCAGNPCTSGKQCCAVINSANCAGYCAVNGTSDNCCGGPATYATVNTAACQGFVNRYPVTYTESYYNCLAPPYDNLTACALCKTYTSCCSTYKKSAAILAASICDHFCGLVPNDAECVKRKQCLDALGHEPSAAELEKCGTSMVRLSSFTVAVLLGVMVFFFLG